jgi:N-acetylmuramoyl-L-alanine amidase
VRLYHHGDQGEPVRDIQDRLRALGYDCGDDDIGSFSRGTLQAVRSFQTARRLAPDGYVGPMTWNTLVEAGYNLGDRLLYRRSPMTRGDDVADVQNKLNALGFDAGIVDGIFGPDTMRAVLDFQQNRAMSEDGIVGQEFIADLTMMQMATKKHGRDRVREHDWLSAIATGIAGSRVYVDAYCRTDAEAAQTWKMATDFATEFQHLGVGIILARTVDTTPPEETRAVRANSLGADFVVSFATPERGDSGVFYFASEYSESASGRAIAEPLADILGLQAGGRTIPLLKDTRATSVVVSIPRKSTITGAEVSSALRTVLESIRNHSDDAL